MNTSSQKITFSGAMGDALDARLDWPEQGPPRAFALFAHCFTCSKDVFAANRISRVLAARGFAVLRFDFTGLGASEGDFANTNFSSNIQDLVAAADFLRAHHQAPKLLIGHSLGGAAVLHAAADIPESQAVATIGAPYDPEHVQHLLREEREVIEAKGQAEVEIGGRRFQIKKQFLDDLQRHAPQETLRKLRRALILFHSPQDAIVDVENARLIYDAARHPKSFVTLDGADHLLTKHRDSVYVADVLCAWATRYVTKAQAFSETTTETNQAPTGANTAEMEPPRHVAIEEMGIGKFTQRVEIGPHHVYGDEPIKMGGNDRGPSPYDYLLAALGTCTTMTMRMYADHKGWPVSHLSATLTHKKIHAKDCADCESTSSRIDYIERHLRIEGDLSDEQRERIVQIADRCPVHRTLHDTPKIVTKMRDESE